MSVATTRLFRVTHGNVDVVALDHETLKRDSPVVSLTIGNIDKVDLTRVERRVCTTSSQQQPNAIRGDIPEGQ